MFFVFTFAVAILGASLLSYREGRQSILLEDFKVYQSALTTLQKSPQAQRVELNDFLKARYYYFANRIPNRYLGTPIDFGSVQFQALPIGKGPTSPAAEYQKLKENTATLRKFEK